LVRRITSLVIGVAMASAVSPTFAADLPVAVPVAVLVPAPAPDPVVAVVTLPFTVVGAVVDTLAPPPPPPAPIVAKY